MANAPISFATSGSNVSDFLSNVNTLPQAAAAPDAEQTAKQILEFLKSKDLTVDEISQGLLPFKLTPEEITKAIGHLKNTDMVLIESDGRVTLTPFAKEALSYFMVR